MSLFESIQIAKEERTAKGYSLTRAFYPTSMWVYIISQAKRQKSSIVKISQSKVQSFANTIGFNTKIPTNITPQQVDRPKMGKNYSMIQEITDKDFIDIATGNIAECFESFFSENVYIKSGYRSQVFKTIGELHDNVSSHSGTSGYSIAQICNDNFEFSISDYGKGFLGELKQNLPTLGIDSDAEAIKWCLQKGNTTKGTEEFDQYLPSDFIGQSPMSGVRHSWRTDGSHHQGFGLYLLHELAIKFGGVLEIATGSCYYKLAHNGQECYTVLEEKIAGVSVSISFNLSDVGSRVQNRQVLDSIHESIIVKGSE
ncbi:hypothetical protein [Leptospira vanthielii]|uniref:ATP-binding protein n=1 Tax=Leptospira vanthielii TaxID=293085 RepID=A0ABY2NKE2_9LEPT|nr:hypothetical protein [Leptospira vanthielii]TGM45986.1 hypothetical protein EHQ95_17515 [Leptospira vanthielii]